MTKHYEELATKSLEINEDFKNQITSVSTELSSTLKDTVGNIKDEIENNLLEQRKSQEQMIEGFQSSFNETMANATNQMNDAITQLDKAMQDEIDSVLRTMAENLSGITQKFVADYTPLLESTKQIVELGKKASRK